MSLGNPVPRSLVIRWPQATDPHWLEESKQHQGLSHAKAKAKAKVHLVHYEPASIRVSVGRGW